MAEYEQYKILDDNLIVPTYNRGWVKKQPKAQNLAAALEKLLTATGLEDAGFYRNEAEWKKQVKNEISELFSLHHIDPEEALYVLTGIKPSISSYRFHWKKEVYFTMRPDFGLRSIISNLNEMPINCYEDAIRDHLLKKASVEIEAIYRAIKNGEILKNAQIEAPFEEWITLFQKRGFELSHIPREYLTDRLSRIIQDNSELIVSLKQSEEKNRELSEKLQQYEKRIELLGGDTLFPRAEKTYLNIIGAFLEIVTGTFKNEIFSSETKLRNFMSEKYAGYSGVSARTLAEKFALAKKSINGEMD